jgi:U6 snRNA-associated Sm-like protein LSm5
LLIAFVSHEAPGPNGELWLSMAAHANQPSLYPLELVDAAVGTRVWIILRGAREFCGILRGFDEYVNLFLEDVDEYTYSEEGIEKQHIDQMFLNGSQICVLAAAPTLDGSQQLGCAYVPSSTT